MLDRVTAYFKGMSATQTQIDWRVSCYTQALGYVNDIERDYFPIAGKKVLDLSCAWGGHAIAFASRGAEVVACDLNDHRFQELRDFCEREKLPVEVRTADCQEIPFDDQFDVILSLDLIEHIPRPEAMSAEIRRLLKPGGVCFLTTPPKLLSVFWKEPHWQLRWLAALPFSWQQPIAKGLFKRSYPFPITQQYWQVSQLRKIFAGMKCKPIMASRKVPLPSMFWQRIEVTHS